MTGAAGTVAMQKAWLVHRALCAQEKTHLQKMRHSQDVRTIVTSCWSVHTSRDHKRTSTSTDSEADVHPALFLSPFLSLSTTTSSTSFHRRTQLRRMTCWSVLLSPTWQLEFVRM